MEGKRRRVQGCGFGLGPAVAGDRGERKKREETYYRTWAALRQHSDRILGKLLADNAQQVETDTLTQLHGALKQMALGIEAALSVAGNEALLFDDTSSSADGKHHVYFWPGYESKTNERSNKQRRLQARDTDLELNEHWKRPVPPCGFAMNRPLSSGEPVGGPDFVPRSQARLTLSSLVFNRLFGWSTSEFERRQFPYVSGGTHQWIANCSTPLRDATNLNVLAVEIHTCSGRACGVTDNACPGVVSDGQHDEVLALTEAGGMVRLCVNRERLPGDSGHSWASQVAAGVACMIQDRRRRLGANEDRKEFQPTDSADSSGEQRKPPAPLSLPLWPCAVKEVPGHIHQGVQTRDWTEHDVKSHDREAARDCLADLEESLRVARTAETRQLATAWATAVRRVWLGLYDIWLVSNSAPQTLCDKITAAQGDRGAFARDCRESWLGPALQRLLNVGGPDAQQIEEKILEQLGELHDDYLCLRDARSTIEAQPPLHHWYTLRLQNAIGGSAGASGKVRSVELGSAMLLSSERLAPWFLELVREWVESCCLAMREFEVDAMSRALGQDSMSFAMSHEVKNIAQSMRDRWLFRPEETIGGLSATEFTQTHTGSDYYIVPFPRLFSAAANLIGLWSWSDSTNTFFPTDENGFPANLADVITYCASQAVDALFPMKYRGADLRSPRSFAKIKRDLVEHVVAVQHSCGQEPCVESTADKRGAASTHSKQRVQLQLHLDEDLGIGGPPLDGRSMAWMDLSRLLVACVGNALPSRNPDDFTEVHVRVSRLPGAASQERTSCKILLTISNAMCKSAQQDGEVAQRKPESPFAPRGLNVIRHIAKELSAEVLGTFSTVGGETVGYNRELDSRYPGHFQTNCRSWQAHLERRPYLIGFVVPDWWSAVKT